MFKEIISKIKIKYQFFKFFYSGYILMVKGIMNNNIKNYEKYDNKEVNLKDTIKGNINNYKDGIIGKYGK